MKKPTTPKKASSLLHGRQSSTLQPLISYASHLQQLTKRIQNALSEPFASHIALANIRNGVATILVDSSTWLGKVRYLAPLIQQTLQQQGLNITRVEFKADPNQHAAREIEYEPAIMSPETGQLLENFSESVENQKLKEALKRLALHGKKFPNKN